MAAFESRVHWRFAAHFYMLVRYFILVVVATNGNLDSPHTHVGFCRFAAGFR